MKPIRRILCPIDFSTQTDPALDYAIALARSFGATVWLVHVLEPTGMLFGGGIASGPLVEGALRSQREHADALLRRAEARCAAANVRVGTQLECGFPRDVLVALSKDADLVVMGTRRRTGLRHLFGSVARRVVRLANCPVTVVPGEGYEPEQASASAA